MKFQQRRWLCALVIALMSAASGCGVARDRADAHQRMLREIEHDMRESAGETGHAELSPCVRRALGSIARERFVPAPLAAAAYQNRPLPIGEGQTISQPFIVALMTQLRQPKPTDVMLEVGTGSGYQAAVLAGCVSRVYSIEIVASLAAGARAALDAAGIRNVETRVGDGYQGAEAAPFDGIIVTAAPDHVPPRLLEQLKPGGRMVIPVGPSAGRQELLVIGKDADGRALTRQTIFVRFVPLKRGGL